MILRIINKSRFICIKIICLLAITNLLCYMILDRNLLLILKTNAEFRLHAVRDCSKIYEKIKDFSDCYDKPMMTKIAQRGDYWVLYNYIKAQRRYRCHESITYTTHGDYSFLDNLVPLVKRWEGPVSVAMYAPGTDFDATLNSIAYLRSCTSYLVEEFVTFHIFFDFDHVPNEVPRYDADYFRSINCSNDPPYINYSHEAMYKSMKNLLYPVNIARNIARETAQTHFILASDIELYPSPKIIPQFLEMISKSMAFLSTRSERKVFPINIFEVSENVTIPSSKTELQSMLDVGTAIPFHQKLCRSCHTIPDSQVWQNSAETIGFHIFKIGKRRGRYRHWEPIFIGTHADPLYDERLSWEGKKDKMTQGYAMCALNYDFLILDNPFLVHKPGIKQEVVKRKKSSIVYKTKVKIKYKIYPELKALYGRVRGCHV